MVFFIHVYLAKTCVQVKKYNYFQIQVRMNSKLKLALNVSDLDCFHTWLPLKIWVSFASGRRTWCVIGWGKPHYNIIDVTKHRYWIAMGWIRPHLRALLYCDNISSRCECNPPHLLRKLNRHLLSSVPPILKGYFSVSVSHGLSHSELDPPPSRDKFWH